VIKYAAVTASGNGKEVKTGILGGTFDPPHNGHIAIAIEVRTKLGLDEIYFVPSARTPLKEDTPILSAERRVEMVHLAIIGYPFFRLSTVEIDRDGVSYTIDTIKELRKRSGDENELFFILGWDNLEQLPQWKEPSQIIEACHLVAVRRPGYSCPDMDLLERAIPGISEMVIFLDEPEMDVSATEIRQRITNGMDFHHLVPERVAEYIEKNRLYREQSK